MLRILKTALMDIVWIEAILVLVLPKSVALPCKRCSTTTDMQRVELIATIFNRVTFFAALTGMARNKENWFKLWIDTFHLLSSVFYKGNRNPLRYFYIALLYCTRWCEVLEIKFEITEIHVTSYFFIATVFSGRKKNGTEDNWKSPLPKQWRIFN